METVPATAERIAAALVAGFDRHYALLRATSTAAKERFEAGDWAGAQRAVRERIRFYDARVAEAVEELRREHADELDEATWQQAKRLYVGLLVDHKRPELAETFFNSVTTRVLGRTYLTNDLLFVRATISTESIESDPPNYRSYYPADGDLREAFARALADFRWSLPFADLDRDVREVVRALEEHAAARGPRVPAPNLQLQVLGSAFYRNKAAYVVGRLVDGDEQTPFAVPVLRCDDGSLELDTILLEEEPISVLFSLSRAYFMVDMDVPSGYVQFLQALMPRKPRSELYTAVGLGKQGKTLFFRDLLHHLHHSQDLFVEALGTRGQVMHVFNLPSYPYVFKVIKDRFGPAKRTDRATVRRKFELAKDVDRVGRMVDAIEFVDLALPRGRFAPELVAQLCELAGSSVALDGEHLVVRHCYVERRMTPLDLYLRAAAEADVRAAVVDYGRAIRELAIANVFPGDLLFRNFGLTRYGRVLFYDYDELEVLTDCVFRAVPEAPNPEAELAEEPWYRVGPRDVFPEEWAPYLLGDPVVRDAFLAVHADLLRPEFWQDAQARIAAGELVDFFPYPEGVRFRRRRAAA